MKLRRLNKKANILQENLVFIILNVVFLAAMLIFIYLQASSVHLLEEESAKKIALLIDASKPNTEIELNLKDFFEKAEKEGMKRDKVVEIDKTRNLVIVRGSKDSFFEYGYFNNIGVELNLNGNYLILEVKDYKS
tara:strand:- start:39 stop:443 length:405 start_codon:yes stop_codon:yes gene_type:complete